VQGEIAGRIAERCEKSGVVAPSTEFLALHERYLSLLTKWNRTINLTSLQLDPLSDGAIDRLLVEPIAASYSAGQVERIVDLGSGGGSPAIPFWTQVPGSNLTMVESRSRKCAFLREVVRQIRPGAGTALDVRFEELLRANPELSGSADIVTIRAVRMDAAVESLVGAILKPSGRVFHFGDTLRIVDCSTWNKGSGGRGSS